ncbi:MAG: alpha/beta hydrolase [Myxococcaceae bacterium]|nr:alpha/beta hydrolase [Myxococcaceae bacterium]
MKAWAARLGEIGPVVRFDYPYMKAGTKRPDPHDKRVAAHREALGSLKNVVLVGKSMGSRMGCHLAVEGAPEVRALVCLGYPLVSPGPKKQRRDEVLVALRTPVLFVQGTRDAMCPLDELAAVRARMTAPSALHVVESGDHSLIARKTWLREHAQTQADVDGAIMKAIRAFLAVHAGLR